MYEILLKWALGILSPGGKAKKHEHKQEILIEAIKTKNAMVLERFKNSWNSYNRLLELALEIDSDLDSFSKSAPETDGTKEKGMKYLGSIKKEFHPAKYRSLLKLISQFECTNDLLSSYSKVFSELLNFKAIISIISSHDDWSGSFIRWKYRGIWMLYSVVIAKIIRISSTDLRFWLTDSPYISTATSHAVMEFHKTIEWLQATSPTGEFYTLSLETEAGIIDFWNSLPCE